MNKLLCVLASSVFPLIVILVVVQLFLSNDLAAAGATVEGYDTTIEKLKEENQLLSRQVAMSGSLESIEARAKQAGFLKASVYMHIAKDQPVALR